jgi:protein arginine kinase
VLSQVREAVASIPSLREAVMYRLDELPPNSRALLHERHLVSKELAGLDAQHPLRSGAAVFLADGLGVMVNEEDHLRLQALRSGFAFRRLAPSSWIGTGRVPYSYAGWVSDSDFRRVGTGMRGRCSSICLDWC